MNDLSSTTVGKKDMGKSLFSVWEDIFWIPNARQKKSFSFVIGNQNSDYQQSKRMNGEIDDGRYLMRLERSVEANGEYDKIMQGKNKKVNFFPALFTRLFFSCFSLC